MSANEKARPEAVLALRSLETGEALREGDLLAEIESDGDARFVCVRGDRGGIRYILARLPGSDAPSRLLPTWAPFIPRTECLLTEGTSHRVLTYSIAPGFPRGMRDVVALLTEKHEDLGVLDLESMRRPDGSIDPDKAAEHVREMKERIPPDTLSELNDALLGLGTDTEPMDRAWETLRKWFADRGWQVENRELTGGPSLRARRFSRESESYNAMASSLMGVQTIMVSSRWEEGGG